MAESERIQGKYIIIYEKMAGDKPDYGSPTNICVGDVVCVYSENGGYQSLLVESVGGSKWTRRITTKDVRYQGYLISKGIEIEPRDIRKILRLKPGEEHSSSLNE